MAKLRRSKKKPDDLDVECKDGVVIVSIKNYYVQLTGEEAFTLSRDVNEAAMEAGI